jgi:REP element-mobilizing transposase RayT
MAAHISGVEPPWHQVGSFNSLAMLTPGAQLCTYGALVPVPCCEYQQGLAAFICAVPAPRAGRQQCVQQQHGAVLRGQEQGVWEVFAYVLMPNHIHLFVRVLQGSLRETLGSFKSWTGGAAASMLGLQAGRFWQREWFDHWSRSGSEDEKISQYVRANPVKAGLVRTSAEWPHGSWPASPPAGGHPR